MKIILVTFLLVTLVALSSAEVWNEVENDSSEDVDDVDEEILIRERRQSTPNEWKLKCKNGDQAACRHVARNHYAWTKSLRERCDRMDFEACHELHRFEKP